MTTLGLAAPECGSGHEGVESDKVLPITPGKLGSPWVSRAMEEV